MGAPNPQQGQRRPQRKVAVGVISPTRLVRDCLIVSLSQNPKFIPRDCLDGTQESLRRLEEVETDVILLDLACPNPGRLAQTIQRRSRRLSIIALGSDGGEEIVRLAEAGFAGFLPRTATLDDLCRTITQATAGELECSPRVAGALARRLGSLSRSSGDPRSPLTSREKQIAALMDQGLSNKEIGKRLSIETATVKNHVHNILDKIGVHRRAEATARLAGRSNPCDPD